MKKISVRKYMHLHASKRPLSLVLAVLITILGLSNSAQAADLREEGGVLKRTRDAVTVIPEFVGGYVVEDSRYNHKQVDRIEISVSNDIPGVSNNNPSLSAFKGDQLIARVNANDCSGDIVNKYSKNMYLFCFSKSVGSARQAWFNISKIVEPETWKDGALLSTAKPLNLAEGYLVHYSLGNAYEKEVVFAAKRGN